ncbi:LPD29 domain-containing protein [Paenibacillus tianjinensis]|uniref:Large polyvalent protein associated domain-containing protein n=1 Tax=Paenibacillus tianjinensis TaxID=2810347 RepID=A0ABX7L5W0_9BACL|nr:LPD29 domain-containing protein [Paenibacillus tianjinensis]QSF43515.1 hypothetical protein JRJ22_19830 [Paenibacillus tianjinensis]
MTKVSSVSAELKKELKSTFPGVKFSVRSSSYSTGSSISVEWNNLPTVAAVEAITNKYSHINRCEVTHEILSGGNTYISTFVDYTPEFIEQVEALMSEASKEIKGSRFYNSSFSKVVDQIWKEQNAPVTPATEEVITESAVNEIPDQTEAAEEPTNSNATLMGQINTIQGVSTKETNMFNLHELHIDGVHVGYTRLTNNKIEILSHINYAVSTAKQIFVTFDELHNVIDQYRKKGIIYYNLAHKPSHSVTPNTIHIPELGHFSGSWVVSGVKDGSVIGEFYERSNIEKFNPEACLIETALQYLQRINKSIKEWSSISI